jgi:AraC-like DNA-binding protein
MRGHYQPCGQSGTDRSIGAHGISDSSASEKVLDVDMDAQSADPRDAGRINDAGCLDGLLSQRSHFNTSNHRAVAPYDPAVAKASMVERLRRVFGELFGAVNEALREKGGYLDERIKRASELLRNDPELHRFLVPEAPDTAATDGCARVGLMPWKARMIKQHIEQHLEEGLRNRELAAVVGLSESHFCRAFKESFGDTPHRYIVRRRIEHARELLLTTDVSLGQIGIDCGLADQAHFCRLFRRFHGESPGSFRRARAVVTASMTMSTLPIARR